MLFGFVLDRKTFYVCVYKCSYLYSWQPESPGWSFCVREHKISFRVVSIEINYFIIQSWSCLLLLLLFLILLFCFEMSFWWMLIKTGEKLKLNKFFLQELCWLNKIYYFSPRVLLGYIKSGKEVGRGRLYNSLKHLFIYWRPYIKHHRSKRSLEKFIVILRIYYLLEI